MKRGLLVVVALLMFAAPVAAQTQVIVNPTTVEAIVDTADHNLTDHYEIGWFKTNGATDLTPVEPATSLGKMTFTAIDATTGKVAAGINVRPLGFKQNYYARLRAVGKDVETGALIAGEWSAVSNPFDRSPGRPGTVTVR